MSRRIDIPLFARLAGDILFVVSLFFVGIVGSRESIIGFAILLTGWVGPVAGVFAWYANPLLFIARGMAKTQPDISRVLAVLGFLVALSAFAMREIPMDDGAQKIVRLGVGYYLWLLCFPLAFLTSYKTKDAHKNATPSVAP